MRCKLRVGEWVVEAEVDDPGSPRWTATVSGATHQLNPEEYTVAWLGPNGEPGRMTRATVEATTDRDSVVLHGQDALR